jgi:transcriptional regulator GlxA family with amidase domain
MPRDREKVFQFIRTNLKYDIHVADLAKQTGHSVGHFAELFINTTGRPPYHYLQEARLLRGHELLLTGDYNVKEVAERVGYSDANHFSELFRSFTGYPPRDVLRRIRTGPVNLPV